jgi:cytochrome P450
LLQTRNFILGNGHAQFSKPPGEEMRKWVNSVPNDGLIRFRGYFNHEHIIPTSPETLKSVLSDHSYDFEKPRGVRKFLTMILGAGLILVEGNVHKFQRKNLLPAFQFKHLKELYPLFWAKSRGLVEAIEQEVLEKSAAHGAAVKNGAEVEFGDWATRVTLDIISVAGLGRDFNSLKNPHDEIVKQYNELLEPTMDRAIYFAANVLGPMDLIQKIPLKQNTDIHRITGNLKQFCLDIVREKREVVREGKEKDGNDILSTLVRSNNFRDGELVDQMLTFLAAG